MFRAAGPSTRRDVRRAGLARDDNNECTRGNALQRRCRSQKGRDPSTAHSDSQSESKCSAQDDKKLRDTPTVCSELQVPRLGATCVAQASLGMTATNQ